MTNEERAERAKAQKREWARAHKGQYKTISITQTADQTEADKRLLAEHKTTVLTVWRDAMKRLREQPTETPPAPVKPAKLTKDNLVFYDEAGHMHIRLIDFPTDKQGE